ncbi:Ionotropic receptor 100a [Carabus blaptoides fortunei]
MTTRPRRDHYDPKGIIHRFCPESGQGVIIVARVMKELLDYMFSEILTLFWSPQSSFFLYFTEENCDDNMKILFENLWRIYKTPHVIVGGCMCKNVLFYNPFFGSNDRRGEMFSFSEEEIIENPHVIENSMLDFNGYPIKPVIFRSPFSVQLSATEFIGIDLNFLNLMGTHLNFSTIVLFPFDNDQYGFKLPNGTFTGALRRLLDGDADLINIDYFIKDYLTMDIEFSSSTMKDNLCVIMRKAEKIPDWQLLYFCMDESTWISVIISFFVMSFSWIFIQKLLTQFREEAVSYQYVFTDTFRLMISSSLFRLPTITSERVFLAFCLMAIVTLVGAFQGSLTGIYSSPMFYKDIDTLEKLSETKTKIKSSYKLFIDDVFSDMTYPVIARLKRMISFYDDPVSITIRVATQKNFATLVRQSEVDIDTSTTTYYDANGINLIHMVKECARSYSLAYPFPVNSPYAPRMNNVILRAAEAGLFVKWYDEMVFNASENASKMNTPSLSDALKVLSLKDMQIAFFQLVIGYVIGFLVFVIEVCLYVCTKNKFPEYSPGK